MIEKVTQGGCRTHRLQLNMRANPRPRQQLESTLHRKQTDTSFNTAYQEPDLLRIKPDDQEPTTQNAISLFHQKQFASALDLFNQTHTPPDQVLALYPAEISGLPAQTSTSSSLLTRDDLNSAVKHLIPYLSQARKRIQRHLNIDGTLKHPPDLQSNPLSHLFSPSSQTPEESASNIEARLQTIARRIDTSLLLSLLHSNPSLVPSLLRLPNFCNPEIVRQKLWEVERYEDLLAFYTSKDLHRETLEFLYTLGKEDNNNDDSFHGPGRTMKYLQTQLPAEDSALLFEFARWPLEEDPKAAISMFTTHASQLDMDEVLTFLSSLPSYEAEMLYLEHLTLNDDYIITSKYIERLIDLYISNGEHHRLQIYLAATLRHTTTVLYASNLSRNLALAQRRAAEQKLLIGDDHNSLTTGTFGRRRQVRMATEDRCMVCQKRFSNTGAVKILPKCEVVHWGCEEKENS